MPLLVRAFALPFYRFSHIIIHPFAGVYEHNDLANALDYTIADMRKWPKMSLFNEDLVCMEREEIEGLSKLALVKLAKQYRVGSERGPARMAKEDLRAYLIQMQVCFLFA